MTMLPTDERILAIAKAEIAPMLRKTPRHLQDDLLQEAMIGAWIGLQKVDDTRSAREQKGYVGKASRSRVMSFLRYTHVRAREIGASDAIAAIDEASNPERTNRSWGLERDILCCLQTDRTASPEAILVSADLGDWVAESIGGIRAGLSLTAQEAVRAKEVAAVLTGRDRDRADRAVIKIRAKLADVAASEGLTLGDLRWR